jgi:hypothetical protein
MRTAIHRFPAWQEKADFVIRAALPDLNREGEPAWEHLWARWIEDQRFEICCIPFFLYDISLGDEVETDIDAQVTRVLSSSGRFTFRVWFGETKNPQIIENLMYEIHRNGFLYESYSKDLISIDADSSASAQLLADLLKGMEDLGQISYETGRMNRDWK